MFLFFFFFLLPFHKYLIWDSFAVSGVLALVCVQNGYQPVTGWAVGSSPAPWLTALLPWAQCWWGHHP